VCVAAVPLLGFACGGSQGDGPGDGGSGNGSGAPTAPNVAPLIVDDGPAGAGGAADVPFVSVTLCVPGTTTCQVIDHVSVDTGSSGMRVLQSVLTIPLPQVDVNGNAEGECLTFADGYAWGSVRDADVKISGELAAKIPVQVIGDTSIGAVPADCANQGSPEDTVMTFGANGLIGINQIVADQGLYYACSGGTCSGVTIPDSAMLPNPVSAFGQDGQGAILQFGTVPDDGAATLSGTLTFGIGSRSNNGLGSAKVLTTNAMGYISTSFDGATLATSFIDSGTNTYAFDDPSIPVCTDAPLFDCPTSTLNLTATNIGTNGTSAPATFKVGNADSLFGSTNTAFDDLASPGIDKNTFDWGFPFFIGRTVFVALQGASTPGGTGPYFAY
jgi:hypothetical protein